MSRKRRGNAAGHVVPLRTGPTRTPDEGPFSASPTPTPAPSSTPPTRQAFTSDLYGYQLLLPAQWEGAAASTRWSSGAIEGMCANSGWDCFTDLSGNGRRLEVAAIQLAAGTTLEEWHAQIDATTPAICKDTDQGAETTLDGEPAIAWHATCADEGLNAIDLVAIHGTRGFLVVLTTPKGLGIEDDEPTFTSILADFHFTANGS